MDINKKNRTELKNYYKTNDQPTEEQFAALIDAQLNQAEDGITKVPGAPLAMKPDSEFGTQEILNLYSDFNQDNPKWTFSLNPRVDVDDPNSNQPGLNIKDATGKSRLFIQSSESRIGIGTIQPSAPLTIKGKSSSDKPDDAMQIADDSIVFGGDNSNENKDSAKLEVDSDSLNVYGKTTGGNTASRKVAVFSEGGMTIKGALNIEGEIAAENIDTNPELGNELTSDNKIPSQKAVKAYVDTRLPKGMITMWSGKVAPEGWALCDGQNGTPDLSGRFIVGYDKDSADYGEIENTGGHENVTLTTNEMPAHMHTGSTSNDGEHKHNIEHNYATDEDGNGKKSILLDGEIIGVWEFDTKEGGEHSHTFQTDSTGDGLPHENRPPFFVLAYIIKL